MTISEKEMTALHSLADKQAGKDVDWINIATARALTELGFARRNRGGWEITPEGLALVKGPATGRTVVPMIGPQALSPSSANEGE
jgi:hypothetical protein